MNAKNQMTARMYSVLTLLSVLPLLIAGQVLWIHWSEGAELQSRGERQASSSVDIPAMRGAILDRTGRALAINTATYDLALDPTMEGFAPQAASFFDNLSRLTGRSAASYRRTVKRRSSPQYVRLARGLSEAQQEEIASWDVPGLILQPRFARRYNYGVTGSHVLGYVSSDGQGLAGLELQYDEHLRGTPGRRAVKRDRRGHIRAFAGARVTEPQHGQSLVLTLDLIRQTILEEELAKGMDASGATWGTAIAMDPHTGAILAMSSRPTFNPNRPGAFTDAARRNHAITDRMEPGSTFKLVAAATAIEQGHITMDDSVETGQGWAVFHGRTMQDSHGYGTIPFRDVIALSSNVGTARTADRYFDPGTFYQYARNLGFGQPTLIDLPGEVGGTLRRPSQWSGTSMTSLAIGYEVAVTPLQMLTAYAALANGGLLVQPHVVAERQDMTGRTRWTNAPDSIRRAFDQETARALRPAFERVVTDGTAEQAQIEGLPVAGKTGTARKTVRGRYAPGKYRATFVGFFPADDPEVAMIVVMDEPEGSYYGGTVAAPVFKRVAERWAATLPKVARRLAPPADSLAQQPRPVPQVAGLPFSTAARRLRAAGFVVSASKPSDPLRPVADQQPAAPQTAFPGTPVRLTLADAPVPHITEDAAPDSTTLDREQPAVRLPDFTGWSTREAAFWLAARGRTAHVQGHGAVTAQTPAPGTPLTESVLTETVVLETEPPATRQGTAGR